MVNDLEGLTGVFTALCDPTRRKIVERLARRAMTAGEIAEGFALSQPAVSRHLKVLEKCGLTKRRIVGREHHFYLMPRSMHRAMVWMEMQEQFWHESLERLDVFIQGGDA